MEFARVVWKLGRNTRKHYVILIVETDNKDVQNQVMFDFFNIANIATQLGGRLIPRKEVAGYKSEANLTIATALIFKGEAQINNFERFLKLYLL